jgi:hypothetical protein
MRGLRGFLVGGLALVVLGAPAVASAAIKVDTIAFDPSGSDTSAKLNQEWVRIKNTGNKAKKLTGWTLRDKGSIHVYKFPSFTLKAGKAVKIHTGSGSNDKNDLYWGQGWFVWNNDGDKATLKNGAGKKKDTCGYSSSASSPYNC